MKKWLLLLLLVALPAVARADMITIMDSQTTTGVGTVTLSPGIVQSFLDTSGAYSCAVYINSAAGSSSTLTVQGGPTSTGPWFDLIYGGVTDIGTTPRGFKGPCPAFVQANLTAITSGAVTVKFERRR